MLKTAIVITLFTICANSHAYPTPECTVFRYISHNGENIGRAEFKNDLTGAYRLTVNMSVPAYLQPNSNIKIELRTPVNDIIKGNPLEYYIYFPSQTHIAKPTRIEFNGRVYCLGPPDEVKLESGVTNLWATTYISTGVSNFNPEPSQYHQDPVPSIVFTTPRNSNDEHTTYSSVIQTNNSTMDCVNITTVDHSVPKSTSPNSWSSKNSSSYSYKCKQVYESNQSIHTVIKTTLN